MIFAYFRLTWAKGLHNNDREERVETLGYLRTFANQLAIDIGIGERDDTGSLILPDGKQFSEYTKLLARCHVSLGEWQASLRDSSYMVGLWPFRLLLYPSLPFEPPQSPPAQIPSSLTRSTLTLPLQIDKYNRAPNDRANNQADPTSIIEDYKSATQLDPEWYEAWHTWALANFEVINQLEVSQQGLSAGDFESYIIPAAEGFLRSISLAPKTSLQDTLRLLTIWFTYGYQGGVSNAIADGLHGVTVDVWLEVIPQVSHP